MGLTSLISPQVPRDSKVEGWPLSSRPCIMQSYFEEDRRTWDVYMSLVEIAWNGSLPERWLQTVLQSR